MQEPYLTQRVETRDHDQLVRLIVAAGGTVNEKSQIFYGDYELGKLSCFAGDWFFSYQFGAVTHGFHDGILRHMGYLE